MPPPLRLRSPGTGRVGRPVAMLLGLPRSSRSPSPAQHRHRPSWSSALAVVHRPALFVPQEYLGADSGHPLRCTDRVNLIKACAVLDRRHGPRRPSRRSPFGRLALQKRCSLASAPAMTLPRTAPRRSRPFISAGTISARPDMAAGRSGHDHQAGAIPAVPGGRITGENPLAARFPLRFANLFPRQPSRRLHAHTARRPRHPKL